MLFLVVFFQTLKIIYGLSEIELMIIRSLVDHFQISHCIVLSDSESKFDHIRDLKIFSNWNMSSVIYSYDQFLYYFTNEIIPGKYERKLKPIVIGGGKNYILPKVPVARTMIVFQASKIDSFISLFSTKVRIFFFKVNI